MELPIIKQEKNWLVNALIGTFGATDQLVASQKKVLFYIALKGTPQTKYSIEKETKINHASVLEAVNELEKKGALKGEKIGQSRAGQDIKKFVLTRQGAFLAIKQFHFWPLHPKEKGNAESIGKVADSWQSLEPILFSKWRYFEKELGQGVGIAFLVLSAFYIDNDENLEEDRDTVIKECFESLENAINYYDYIKDDQKMLDDYTKNYGRNAEASLDAWVKVIRQDSDLKKYFVNYLDFLYFEAENRLSWGQYLKQGPGYAAKWLI